MIKDTSQQDRAVQPKANQVLGVNRTSLIALTCATAIALIGWNLNETTKMRTEILQIQQGQVILFKKINRVQKVLKRKANR